MTQYLLMVVHFVLFFMYEIHVVFVVSLDKDDGMVTEDVPMVEIAYKGVSFELFLIVINHVWDDYGHKDKDNIADETP